MDKKIKRFNFQLSIFISDFYQSPTIYELATFQNKWWIILLLSQIRLSNRFNTYLVARQPVAEIVILWLWVDLQRALKQVSKYKLEYLKVYLAYLSTPSTD